MNWKRAAIAVAAMVAFLVANLIVLSFMYGFTIAFVEGTSIGVFAMIGAYVFVAPFNYVCFRRWLSYCTGGAA